MPGFKGIESKEESARRLEVGKETEIDRQVEPFIHPPAELGGEGVATSYEASRSQGLKDFLEIGEQGGTPEVRLNANLQRYQRVQENLPTDPVSVDMGKIGSEAERTLLQEILQDPTFIKNSIENIFPEMQGQAILQLRPQSHFGKGKFLFEVSVEFQNGQTRKLLLLADEGPGLAARYGDISRAGSELAHRFGHAMEVGKYHVFSVNFHTGISFDNLTGALESLVGIPGHPMNRVLKRTLETVKLERLEEGLNTLVQAGVMTEADQTAILEFRKSNDAAGLAGFEKKLQGLLFQLDQSAIEAQFRFYRETGYQQTDPRRENMIFEVVNGGWVFKVIDYESMTRETSAKKVILDYDIFEERVGPGVITMSVRPWAWSFTPNKSGYFEAILNALGEATGIDFLKQALTEFQIAGRLESSTDQRARMSLLEFLNQKGRF